MCSACCSLVESHLGRRSRTASVLAVEEVSFNSSNVVIPHVSSDMPSAPTSVIF
jgi:hypothetical protein